MGLMPGGHLGPVAALPRSPGAAAGLEASPAARPPLPHLGSPTWVRSRRGSRHTVLVLTTGLCLLAAGAGRTAISTDGTVGPLRGLSGAMTIGEGLGTRAGNNLFHSFRTFTIATGESATFTGSADIANVISRVTGGAASSIDGLLRSQVGQANFFLINPAGVVFGPNAQVDVPGAFHVSTADRLNFPDGYYSATDIAGSTLSVAAPESFGFLAHQAPADITVSGSQLDFKAGQTVSMVGGNVTATIDWGTFSFAQISSEGGDVRVVAVGTPDAENRVAVRDGSSNLAPKGRVEVSVGATIDVTDYSAVGGAESILIRGGTVDISGYSSTLARSGLLARHTADQDSAGVIRVEADAITMTNSDIDAANWGDGRGGSIVLEARDTLQMKGSTVVVYNWGNGVSPAQLRLRADSIGITDSRIDASAYGNGAGSAAALEAGRSLLITDSTIASDNWGNSPKAATLSLTGADISVLDSDIRSLVFGGGPGADIAVTAGFLGISAATAPTDYWGIRTGVRPAGWGAAGDIHVDAEQIVLLNGGQISSVIEVGARGGGGNLDVKVGSSMWASGSNASAVASGLYATTRSADAVDGGDIGIDALGAIVSLANGATILSGTAGRGNSGAIWITAGDFEASGGSSIYAPTWGSGAGGDLTIRVVNSMALSGASMQSWSAGSGAGGDVTVLVGGGLTLGGEASVMSYSAGSGAAGDLTIAAGRDLSLDGVKLDASADADGAAGSLMLHADGSLIMNAGILDTSTDGAGRAGDIGIQVGGDINLRAALVRAGSNGTGAAGNLSIDVRGSFIMDDGSWLDTLTRGGGMAGDIGICASGDIRGRDGAVMNSETFGAGRAGTIELRARGTVELTNSSFLFAGSGVAYQSEGNDSESRLGEAGRITIVADSVTLLDSGLWVTSQNHANAGVIDVTAQRGILVDTTAGLAGGLWSANLRAPTAAPIDPTRVVEEGRSGVVALCAARITFDHGSMIDISSDAGDGGSVSIDAGTLNLFNGAIINAATTADGAAGDIAIRTTMDIRLSDGALMTAQTSAQGPAGVIALSAVGAVELANASNLRADSWGNVEDDLLTRLRSTFSRIAADLADKTKAAIERSKTKGQGRTGTSALSAVSVMAPPDGSSPVADAGAVSSAAGSDLDPRLGDAGRITIAAGAVTLRDSDLSVASANRANAGVIEITAVGDIDIGTTTGAMNGLWAANQRPVTAPALDPMRVAAEGRSGSIGLTARAITLANGAIIDISSSAGDGGSVTVDAAALSLLDGAVIWAVPSGLGAGGDVRVAVAGALLIAGKNPNSGMNAGIETANTDSPSYAAGVGPAGSIAIAADTLTIGYGGEINSSSYSSSAVSAGPLTLKVGSLEVRDGGAILSATTGAGAAGDIRIDASRSVAVRGLGDFASTIFADAASPLAGLAQGRGGTIRIGAPEVLIEQGGEILSQTLGSAAAGAVTLIADRLSIRSGGEINTGSIGEIGDGPAGSIDIRAGLITLDGRGVEVLAEPWRETGILSTSLPGGGAAGNIRIQAIHAMDLIGGATLSTSTASAYDAGDIVITAGTLTIDQALLASRAAAGATGFVGNIDVTAGLLDLRNLGEISIAADQTVPGERLASAPDNRIRIAAADLRLTTGGTIIAASTGNVPAGAIEISGQRLSASGGASIQSDASGSGAAGRIALQVAAITLDSAEVRAATSGSGAGGAIRIEAADLLAANGARVRSGTAGSGNAGTLDLNISGLLALAPGTELSTSTSGGGDAGRLGVTAGTLDLNNAALTSRADAGAGGQAGAITVSAGAIDLRNAAQISSASNQGVATARPAGGPAGQISISAAALRLDGASGITAASTGSVPAGSITIAAGAVSLAGQSRITTESVNADGGAIDISAQSLWLTDSQITTSVLGAAGSGGDIRIRTGLLGLNGCFIQANTGAAGAAGGDLSIVADRVVLSRGFVQVGGNERLAFRPGSGLNVIQAAAPAGVQGNIVTTVPQLDVTQGLTALEVPVGDPAGLVRDRCLVGSALAGSSLVEQPVAGLPAAPAAPAVVSFAGERLDRLLAEGG